MPSTYERFGDTFEDGTLEDWVMASGSVLGVTTGAAFEGSYGLAVTVSPAESHVVRGTRRDIARADEAYLRFRFDPNDLIFNDPGTGWIPNRSIQFAAIQGPGRHFMVAIRFRRVAGVYEGFLEWHDASGANQLDFVNGSFRVPNRWQEVTIGFRRNGWVACWIDGALVRTVSGVTHDEPYASIIEAGKTNLAPLLTNPVGTLRFDDISLLLPTIPDLWVDTANGNDSNDGLTPGTAFATISRASDLAGAGTVVHIQPGIYRESINPAQGGTPGQPATYRAADGPGTAIIRGSLPSSAVTWTRLSTNSIGLPSSVATSSIWWADLGSWNLDDTPAFVVTTDAAGRISSRLPLAREPDWTAPDWKRFSQLWWVANGGQSKPSCDPATDPDNECDRSSRSSMLLTDDRSETQPAGVEPGDLTTLGSLVGATIFARECFWGHYMCRRTITAHDVVAGRVTVDHACYESDGDPGLGWGSQYFVENHPRLLDSPGEWWFDRSTHRLYVWPPTPGDPRPQNLEISRLGIGVDLKDLSYVTFENLDIELFNDSAFENQNWVWQASAGNEISGCRIRYAQRAVLLSQFVEDGTHADKQLEGFTVDSCEISHMDHESMRLVHHWDDGDAPDSWVRPGVLRTTIRNNTISDVGFRPPSTSDDHGGLMVWHGVDVTLEGNRFLDMAQEGIKVFKSIVQSPATWGFNPAEIKTGGILIRNNAVERACQLKNDCGAINISGPAPDQHVFKNVLVYQNTLRDTFGWSWSAEHRGLWSAGQFPGAGGIGLYIGNSSGIHAFRNVLFDNGYAGVHMAKAWRDGPISLYNNVAANNAFGIHIGGLEFDTHPTVGLEIRNNIFIRNTAYGIKITEGDTDYTGTEVDRNLYFDNGWQDTVYKPGAMKISHDGPEEYLQTLAEIRANTPFEANGQSGDPAFLAYDPTDSGPFDAFEPDFRLEPGSRALDAGTTLLSTALQDVLSVFGITDPPANVRYDQGAFEGACGDGAVSDTVVLSTATYSACATLTVGPNVSIGSTGTAELAAGRSVIMTNGVSVENGGTMQVMVEGPPY